MKKIAINGFGRIGRLVFRQLVEDSSVEVVALNDLTDAKTLAHLLKYDTAHGQFNGSVEVKNGNLVVNGKEIKVLAERDPKNLPWGELGIDIVVESTGFFVSKEGSQSHIDAGAKKVLISAPAKGDLKTIVYSVNHDAITSDDKIVSAASCTTNALSPVANVLENSFGIEKGIMTTIHAYTADQGTQDRPHKDLRRARAGAQNFVPTTTGAAAAVGKVLPSLNGKLDGIAVRGPIITGSLVDLVVEFKDQNVTVEKINAAMKNAASDSLGYTEDPIVSSDIIGSTHGSIFDSLMTKELKVDGKSMFKLLTWYDNECSFVSQYVRTLKHMLSI
ncbi:MAG: type I glyceraldehyde-3-phosphate dehydrogenase [Mycoplasmatales bacterium]|nr:type I glyceraldehyde-3-phosphate dehydrogenase [Mycoplasmatales bacterium]